MNYCRCGHQDAEHQLSGLINNGTFVSLETPKNTAAASKESTSTFRTPSAVTSSVVTSSQLPLVGGNSGGKSAVGNRGSHDKTIYIHESVGSNEKPWSDSTGNRKVLNKNLLQIHNSEVGPSTKKTKLGQKAPTLKIPKFLEGVNITEEAFEECITDTKLPVVVLMSDKEDFPKLASEVLTKKEDNEILFNVPMDSADSFLSFLDDHLNTYKLSAKQYNNIFFYKMGTSHP
jgi:hypothetical protein